MEWIRTCTFIALLAAIPSDITAAKILGIASLPSHSHKNILQPLFMELANRGHEVTVISPFPLTENVPNYTDIPVNINLEKLFGERNAFEMTKMPFFLMLAFMWTFLPKLTDIMLTTPAVRDLIRDETRHFDLILSEYFANEAIVGFSHRFKAPIVGIFTSSGHEMISEAVGDPYPYSVIPHPNYDFSDHMTFMERLQNTIINSCMKIGRQLFYLPTQESMMRKYFNITRQSPSLVELYYNTSLMLVNGHPVYSNAKAHVPNFIEVGGLHIKPTKKLPENLKQYLDNSPNGVVYFSMGSTLKSANMSTAKKTALLNAFAKLEQRILWKFEDESLKNIPQNVKIQKWLPQSDLLAHPNLRVFITHGGLLSTQEAMYHGVPLIGIPIFADQKMNVKNSVRQGYAVLLEYENITEESLYWTINEVITNEKYAANAKKISSLLQDQLQAPMEKAIFWIEYVMRHKGAPHLRSAAQDLAWYQLYLLDVMLVLLLILGAIIILPIFLLKTVIRKFWGKKTPEKKSKKDN